MTNEILSETDVSAILRELPENLKNQILATIQHGAHCVKADLAFSISKNKPDRRAVQGLFLECRDILSDFGLKPEA